MYNYKSPTKFKEQIGSRLKEIMVTALENKKSEMKTTLFKNREKTND